MARERAQIRTSAGRSGRRRQVSRGGWPGVGADKRSPPSPSNAGGPAPADGSGQAGRRPARRLHFGSKAADANASVRFVTPRSTAAPPSSPERVWLCGCCSAGSRLARRSMSSSRPIPRCTAPPSWRCWMMQAVLWWAPTAAASDPRPAARLSARRGPRPGARGPAGGRLGLAGHVGPCRGLARRQERTTVAGDGGGVPAGPG